MKEYYVKIHSYDKNSSNRMPTKTQAPAIEPTTITAHINLMNLLQKKEHYFPEKLHSCILKKHFKDNLFHTWHNVVRLFHHKLGKPNHVKWFPYKRL